MNGIEAIVFDKDGTLFDFQATWSGVMLRFLDEVAPGELRHAAAEALGVDPVSGAFQAGSVVVACTTHEVAATLAPVTDLGESEIVGVLDRLGERAKQVPVVDLVPCLARLGDGRVLGLVTNDSEAPARAHLDAYGIAELFRFVAGYASGFGAKPAPGQLLAFTEATGTNPGATLMVGDSRHDLEAGRAAGMITVGVLTGIATAGDLSDLADVVLPDIGHLDAWITERHRGGR